MSHPAGCVRHSEGREARTVPKMNLHPHIQHPEKNGQNGHGCQAVQDRPQGQSSVSEKCCHEKQGSSLVPKPTSHDRRRFQARVRRGFAGPSPMWVLWSQPRQRRQGGSALGAGRNSSGYSAGPAHLNSLGSNSHSVLPGCVTSDKSPNLSSLSFSICKTKTATTRGN